MKDQAPQDVIACFELGVKCLLYIFTWPDLKTTKNRSILKALLTSIAKRAELQLNTTINMQQLTGIVFGYMLKFFKNVPNLNTAIQYLKLMEAIANTSVDPQKLGDKIGWLADRILEKDWDDQRMIKPDGLSYLINKQITERDQPLEVIARYITTAFPALQENNETELQSFALLDNETFITFYKEVFTQLVLVCSRVSKKSKPGQGKNRTGVTETGEDEEDDGEVIEKMTNFEKLAMGFSGIIQVTKSIAEKKGVLAVMLKKGRDFMDAWNKNVMGVLSRYFRDDMDAVKRILTLLQKGTRDLQAACGDSKYSKDNTLMSIVPQTRKALEIFLFEVKKMLGENKALSAFWIGSLKHRSLKGEVVSSQIQVDNSDSEPEEKPRKLVLDRKGIAGPRPRKRKNKSSSDTSPPDPASHEDDSGKIEEIDTEEKNEDEEEDQLDHQDDVLDLDLEEKEEEIPNDEQGNGEVEEQMNEVEEEEEEEEIPLPRKRKDYVSQQLPSSSKKPRTTSSDEVESSNEAESVNLGMERGSSREEVIDDEKSDEENDEIDQLSD
ncbi:Fanconi anemia group D2 protein [Nowakowskiella sp. JEL0407]|nr:Fanconi anemia group D2 protein [Nowakowskiella sp. JEL0407]